MTRVKQGAYDDGGQTAIDARKQGEYKSATPQNEAHTIAINDTDRQHTVTT